MDGNSFQQLSRGASFRGPRNGEAIARLRQASARPSPQPPQRPPWPRPVLAGRRPRPLSISSGTTRGCAPPPPASAAPSRHEPLAPRVFLGAVTLAERDADLILSSSGSASESESEGELAAFRSRLNIRCKGSAIPDLCLTFDSLPSKDRSLHSILLKNVERSRFTEPTPIQMQSIPCLMAGRDFIGVSPTGTGKTAAYLLPLILRLNRSSSVGIRGLIVTPTRELAMQIHKEFLRLSDGRRLVASYLSKSVAAGNKIQNQDKIDILLATPMRLLGLLRDGQVSLDRLQQLILDESDKLFEMGFVDQVDEILSHVPSNCQFSLFSATLPPQVETLANTVLKDPIRCVVGTLNGSSSSVKQELVFVGTENGKLMALRNLFVESKERAQDLYKELAFDGIPLDVIHSGRTKAQRDEIIERFRLGSLWVLIATDLMGRGIDFKGVNMVINFDLPQTVIQYIHRIGRTGRANREGRAVTYFTEDDIPMVRSLANVMRLSGSAVPEWILRMKKVKDASEAVGEEEEEKEEIVEGDDGSEAAE